MELNVFFTVAYAIGFVYLIVVEAIGIKRKAKGDTITEHWRYIDKSLHGIIQWGWRVMTGGFLVWILFHFAADWK